MPISICRHASASDAQRGPWTLSVRWLQRSSVALSLVERVDTMNITPEFKRLLARARRILRVVHLCSHFLLPVPSSVEASSAASCSRSVGDSFEMATANSASELLCSMGRSSEASSRPSRAAAFVFAPSLEQAMVQAGSGVAASSLPFSLATDAR